MRRSDIFDSFVKIAQEKGLISNDSSDSKKKLEETGRADSLDISDIEALYGVKPDAPKGSDYKKNIMEAAHPNSVVVSPSYDKLNGLVENNIEQQNILLHIVNKTPDGLSTHRKYAQQDFVLSLVRLGNELDNKNQDELRSLADFCLLQASQKKIVKTAEPVTIALLVAIPLLLGGLYAKQHLRFISDGFQADHQKLMAEIEDILTGNSDYGVGYDYKPEFLQMLRNFKAQLQEYYNVEKQIEDILEKLQMPKNIDELKEIAKQPETPEVANALKTFQAATLKIWSLMEDIVKDFGDESYKQRQIKDKGFLTKLIDAPQIFHGGKGLVADDFDDVKHALQTYMLDIENINKVLGGTTSFAQNARQRLQSAMANSPGAASAKPSTPTPGAPSPTVQSVQQSGTAASIEDQLGIGGLAKSLTSAFGK